MSSQFAVGYSADAVQYNQGQAYYLLGGENSNGDVIPGNLLVGGNLAVTGTTTLTGATSMQTGSAAAFGVTGQLSTTGLLLAAGTAGASVTGAGGLNVTANAAVGGSVTCASLSTTGALIVGATLNAAASIQSVPQTPTASPFFGLQGTKNYELTLVSGNNEIGLAPLVNTGYSHILALQMQEVAPTTPGDAGFLGILITIPANASEPPAVLSNTIQGNGYAIAIVGPNPPLDPLPGYRIQMTCDIAHIGKAAVAYTVLI